MPFKYALSLISSAKDELLTPQEYAEEVGNDYRPKIVAEIYKYYQNKHIFCYRYLNKGVCEILY